MFYLVLFTGVGCTGYVSLNMGDGVCDVLIVMAWLTEMWSSVQGWDMV